MTEIKIQKEAYLNYLKASFLIAGLYIVGRIILYLGLEKTLRDHVESYTCHYDNDNLYISSQYAIPKLPGFLSNHLKTPSITIKKIEKVIPLKKITNFTLKQNFRLHQLNLWKINIDTAGNSTATIAPKPSSPPTNNQKMN